MQRMRQIHRLLAMNTAIPEIDLCQLAFTDHSSRSPLMSRQLSLAIFFLALTAATFAQNPVAQTRDQKVRGDKAKVEADGFWIYNDLNRGFAEAKKTGMPLIVVLRCIPCEQCVKLDDDLVDKDERLRPLLEKFVRVRVISANGLDLSLFQYDTDQSFAVFLLNADRTINATGPTTFRLPASPKHSKGRWPSTKPIPRTKPNSPPRQAPRPTSPRRKNIRNSPPNTALN
jgi:hypothetical protein